MEFKNVEILENTDVDSIENKFKDNISIKQKNKYDDEDHLTKRHKFKKILIIKIVCLICYFLVIISIENFYRKTLYNKSKGLQENIKGNKTNNNSFYIFWKIISLFGEETFILVFYMIIFLFFPLNISFFILLIIIYSSYFIGLLKMIYKESRPYWESEILDIVCNKGYGNPSGHSLISGSLFFSLPHIITNYFSSIKKNKILKIIIFCIFFILALLIMISRFILGAHSLNQIIYGFTFGIGLYFLFIYILSYHTYNSLEFLTLIRKRKVFIIYTLINSILLIVTIITYFSIKENEDYKQLIYKNIFNGVRCKKPKKFSVFKNQGLFQSLLIILLIGTHLGLKILEVLLKKYKYKLNKYIIEFNQSSFKRWFFRLPILLFSMIGIGLSLLVPDDSNLIIIFIFKSGSPFFLCSFGLYSFGIFLSIYFNLANENISKISEN